MKTLALGTKVYLKNVGPYSTSDWGIVNRVDGDIYHIGLYGDKTTSLVFMRDEFTVPRKAAV